jgi:hypothetical protein
VAWNRFRSRPAPARSARESERMGGKAFFERAARAFSLSILFYHAFADVSRFFLIFFKKAAYWGKMR